MFARKRVFLEYSGVFSTPSEVRVGRLSDEHLLCSCASQLPNLTMASIGTRYHPLGGRRFLERFKSAFTTCSDGSTWPKWERTWTHAGQYFRVLLRPGRRNSITGLACRVNADSERLERFVRESPWEHDAVERHLRASVPLELEGQDAAFIVDGMGVPKTRIPIHRNTAVSRTSLRMS